MTQHRPLILPPLLPQEVGRAPSWLRCILASRRPLLVDPSLHGLKAAMPTRGILLWWVDGERRMAHESDLRYANATPSGEVHTFETDQVVLWLPGWEA